MVWESMGPHLAGRPRETAKGILMSNAPDAVDVLGRDDLLVEVISVMRAGQAWAVKHRGGFLGHANSYEEATSIGQDLVGWLESQGRPAHLVVIDEPRSFAARS